MRTRNIFTATLLAAFCLGLAQAQTGTNFYFNGVQLQRNNLNPAFESPYSVSVGIPGISGLNMRLENNFFSWDALVTRGADDSLRFDVQRLIGKANHRSRIAATLDEEVLRVGWRHKRNSFVIGLSVHADMQLVLGKETLSFFLQGPGAHIGNNTLSGNRFDFNSYACLYFGYSRLINKNLSVGGRFKLIHGLYNFHTQNIKLKCNILNEDMSDPELVPYQYQIHIDGSFRTNLPIDNDFKLGSLSFQPFRNMGAAIDLGVDYRFDNGFEVSASVLDLGFIVWGDDNAAKFRSIQSNTDFKGIDINRIKREGASALEVVKDMVGEVWDSLGLKRNDSVSGKYANMLPASINLGFSYTLLDIHRFGVLLRGQFYNRYFAPEVGVSYTIMPCKNFALSVSNTFCSGNILNLGLSLAVNAGPVQFHIGVDRINSFNVAKMRTASVSFGINLVFGKSKYDWYTGDADYGEDDAGY
ncbi:MAG: DUF5723 family protein [Bacteroides sp.]|nr:DUF5723 family protein [Bacteroides sp.]MCM1530755.1 DUF5723 family protein [Ruminococcus flavefaciens]MCM1554171.1 DUF5723 family protein [Bacteroides sp.]